MIRTNDLESKVKLGLVTKNQLKYMMHLGDISSNVSVYSDYIPGTSNLYLNIYVINFFEKRPKIVMELLLSKVSTLFNLPTYCVTLVGIDDLYKGFNLAPKIYAYLLKNFTGWILRSGSSQSPGGKSIWNSLCRERGVSVYAHSRKNNDTHQCHYSKDGVIECYVDLYDSRSDYYLYAVRD